MDTNILNSNFYESRITDILMKGVPVVNLKMLLNETYSIAKDISTVSNKNIVLRANRLLLMSFDHVHCECQFTDDISELFQPTAYSNFDIVRFFIRIAQFLENTFGFDEASLLNNTTEGKIQSIKDNGTFLIKAVSYFNKIESFFQKCVELFFLQLDPAKKALTADCLGIGFNHDTLCEYFIHPSTNLFNLTYFKINFGYLLLPKKKEDEGLQMLLNETFNLCKEIMSLYVDRLGSLQQVNTVRIFFEDINGEINYYRSETDPTDGYEILGNYELYNYSLKIYEYMLSKGFTPLATTISSEKTNPLIEDGHSVPKQAETEEVITLSDESETNNDPKQFISDCLDPLTKENYLKGKNKKAVFCINSSFKNHLIGCFLALHLKNDLPKFSTKYDINLNIPFYDAILLIMEKFDIKTKHVIYIITESLFRDNDDLRKGAPRTVRNELTNARKRKKAK
jgi:hypothetical protein